MISILAYPQLIMIHDMIFWYQERINLGIIGSLLLLLLREGSLPNLSNPKLVPTRPACMRIAVTT